MVAQVIPAIRAYLLVLPAAVREGVNVPMEAKLDFSIAACEQNIGEIAYDFSRQSTAATEADLQELNTLKASAEAIEAPSELPMLTKPFLPAVRPSKLSNATARCNRDDSEENPVSPTSPHSMMSLRSPTTSKSHVTAWMLPRETLFIFDFDDTLFPTSAIMADPRLNPHEVAPCFQFDPLMPANFDEILPEGQLLGDVLWQHEQTVAALLRRASSLGKVVIVTLAELQWVDLVIQNFLPSLKDLLEELHIEVRSARSFVTPRVKRMAIEDGVDCSVLMKARAISRVIREFYGRRPKFARSWKNIINVGDSNVEHHALSEVVMSHQQCDKNGCEKPFRSKIVKLQPKPTCEVLTAELQVLLSWLWEIVHHDGDFMLDLSSEEDSVANTFGDIVESCSS